MYLIVMIKAYKLQHGHLKLHLLGYFGGTVVGAYMSSIKRGVGPCC